MAYIALHQWHDAVQSLAYSEQYHILQDSINKITATESVSQTNALYNYSLREKENNRLLIKQKNYQIYISMGIIVLLVMTTSISFLVIRNNHKRRLLIGELEKEQAKNFYFEDYIKQREAIISQMEREAATNESEKGELKAEISRQRQLLSDYTLSAKQTKELALLLPGDIKTSPTYIMLQNFIHNGEHLKNGEESDIINMMNIYHPIFMNHLKQLTILSHQELLICILTKLNIANKDIASLTVKTESTISSTRIRIYEKIMKTKGTAKQFNNLISSL